LRFSKASASILAVDERQSLESLTREEKVAGRALAQLREKEQEFEERKANLEEELQSLNTKRQEVRPFTQTEEASDLFQS
jgi:structural maintenance of chromosome 1